MLAEVGIREGLIVSDEDGSYLIKVPTIKYTIIACRIEFDIIWMTGRKLKVFTELYIAERTPEYFVVKSK
jgi:hypothetical protein